MQTQTHKNPKKKPSTKKPAAAVKAKAKKPEAAKKARDVEIKATFKRDLPVPLTEKERNKRTDEYMRLLDDRKAIEAKSESQRELVKAELKALEPEIEKLEAVIRDKAEPRAVECEEVHDFRRGQVFTRRKDTGETVDGTERPMKHEERQQKLAGIVNEDIKAQAQKSNGKANGGAVYPVDGAKPNGKHEAKAAAPKNPPNWHRAANLDRSLAERQPVAGDVWVSRKLNKEAFAVFRVEKVHGEGTHARAELRAGSAPSRVNEAKHAKGTIEGLACTEFDVGNVEWSNILSVVEDVGKLWLNYALLEAVEPEKAKG